MPPGSAAFNDIVTSSKSKPKAHESVTADITPTGAEKLNSLPVPVIELHSIFLFSVKVIFIPVQSGVAFTRRGFKGSVITALPPPNDKS